MVLVVGLAACRSGPPENCEVANQQGFECSERYRDRSDRELFLACLPFSRAERIAGAWVTGFETNEFYEGQRASSSLIHKSIGHTQLIFAEQGSPVPSTTVYQMEFVGRRSKCDMRFPRHHIIVDRVISKVRVASL